MSDLLRDPMLLEKLIEDIQKSYCLVGNKDVIVVLINKISMRLVKGAKPTSSNLVVSSDTGSGKDFTVDTVIKVMAPSPISIHITGISEKAPNYFESLGDMTGKVLYLEDPDNKTLETQAFRTLASGGNKILTVEGKGEKKLYLHEIKGKPVIIVTTMNSTIDKEGDRRWDTIRVDDSDSTTLDVLKLKADEACGITTRNDSKYTSVIGQLQKVDVIIPFSREIINAMDDKMKKNLIMRTKINSLYDFIKASAALHQLQREQDSKGRIIATIDDYRYGKLVFEKINKVTGNVTQDEQVFLDILKNERRMSIHELAEKGKKRSVQWFYYPKGNTPIDRWVEKGLVEVKEDYSEKAGKSIKMLYYVGNILVELPEPEILSCFKSILKTTDRGCLNDFKGFKDNIETIGKNEPVVPQSLENHENIENPSIETVLKSDENLEIARQCEERMRPSREYSSKQVCYDLGFIDKGLYSEDLEDALDDVTMRPNNPTKVRKLGDDRYCLYTQ